MDQITPHPSAAPSPASATPALPATSGRSAPDPCAQFTFLSPGRAARIDAVPSDPGVTYQNVQDAVDEIYELRSKVIRIALMSVILHRPDPNTPTTAREREECLLILRTDVQQFRAVVDMLHTGSEFAGISPEIRTWICKLAKEKPAELASANRVAAASEALLQAAETETDRSAALRQHRATARQGFHEAVITLCEHIWADFERDRAALLARAHTAAASLSKRLTRLERIGTHVRLVSLNATVEASRVGDAGRGLTLIAQEFKILAEEVRALANQARGDVASMRIDN